MNESAGQEADRKVDAPVVSSESGKLADTGMTFDDLAKYIKDAQQDAATKTEQAKLKAEAPAEWKRGQDIVELTDAICQVTQRSYGNLTDQNKKDVEDLVDKGFNKYGDVKFKDGAFYVYAKNDAGILSEPLILPLQDNTPPSVIPSFLRDGSQPIRVVAGGRADIYSTPMLGSEDEHVIRLVSPELKEKHERLYNVLVDKIKTEGGYKGLIASLKEKDPAERERGIKALHVMFNTHVVDSFLTDEVIHSDDFKQGVDVNTDGTITPSSSHYTQTREAQGRLSDSMMSTYGKAVDEFAKSIGASSPEEIQDFRNLMNFSELPGDREKKIAEIDKALGYDNEKQIAKNE